MHTTNYNINDEIIPIDYSFKQRQTHINVNKTYY